MTIIANGSPFWLYFELGNIWVHLEGVTPGVAVDTSRPSSSYTALDGTVRVQVTQRENRTWALAFTYEDAEASRWLERAARNPGPVWLYDQTAGFANMLDDRSTEGTLSSATLVTVAGVPMRSFQIGDGFTVKLRDGVSYQIAYTTTHTAAATIGTYDVGAGAVNIVAPAGSGARRGSVSFVPASNVDAVVAWTVANKTSGAQLTESSVSSTWSEGHNTPCRVFVQKGGRTALQAFSDKPALFDRSFSLQEVG